MEERPNALLLKFPGTNCDFETARALEASGFSTTILPIAAFKKESLDSVKLVVLSGGFSCLLYTSPSPRDVEESRMPSSA